MSRLSDRLSGRQRGEVARQVDAMLARNPSFAGLPPAEQAAIRDNTAAIAETLAENQLRQARRDDPRAGSLAGELPPMPSFPGQRRGTGDGAAPSTDFTGGARERPDSRSVAEGEFGTGVATGVEQAGETLRQVNFPAFVAELIQGVFQAVVDASIQQMRAYGELVQSVTMSLNDFRDANVTENQARDHLVNKFPNLMQLNIGPDGPRVGPRADAEDADLSQVTSGLDLGEPLGDLDEDTIEEVLVPAARNDLARSRQSLLATMLLMGINRIVVTDGHINAKLKFSFSARDSMQRRAQDYDYQSFGTTTTSQSQYDRGSETGESYSKTYDRKYVGKGRYSLAPNRSGESRRWETGADQTMSTPAIYLTDMSDTATQAELEAGGKLTGDVSLNFKSETFDINKIATAGEIFSLQRVSGAGRGAPAPNEQTAAAASDEGDSSAAR